MLSFDGLELQKDNLWSEFGRHHDKLVASVVRNELGYEKRSRLHMAQSLPHRRKGSLISGTWKARIFANSVNRGLCHH